MLDFNPGDFSAEAAAYSFARRQTLSGFRTGYCDQVLMGDGVSDVLVIRKPVSSVAIAVNVATARAATHL